MVRAHRPRLQAPARAQPPSRRDNRRVDTIEQWWSAGERVELGSAGRRIFVRRFGSGPVLTLLHGFPSSSHDWARIAPALARSHTLLMPDLLGFGASEKPAGHDYSLHEQADLVEALWRRAGVAASAILAHDYSVSVIQELLARALEGTLEVALSGALLLNGGLYPELHRLQPAQVALLDPEQGPRLSALIDEQAFVAGLRPTFAEGFDAAADSSAIWRSVEHGGGARIMHLLIGYVRDRERHRDRWVGALERTPVPLSFVWGMRDPVSGAHMAQRIRERLPRAPFTALADDGHWPALEAPQQVIAALESQLPWGGS